MIRDFDADMPILSGRAALIWLGLLVILTRLPYFFEYVVGGSLGTDEGTYVLVAQSLLDGHLPYVQLWDLKPPVGFAVIAAALAIFGENIIAVRVLGAICVLVVAWQTWLLATRFASRQVAVIGSSLFVVGAGAIQGGQATMMEFVAMPFLMAAVLLLTTSKSVSPGRAVATGALVALAALTRMNLGVVAPLLGLAIVWLESSRGLAKAASSAVSYAIGGCLVLLLCALPYLVTGHAELFRYSVFEASMAHSGSNLDLSSALRDPIRHALGLHRGIRVMNPDIWAALLIWLPAGIGLPVMLVKRAALGVRGSSVLPAVLAAIGIGVSIVAAGQSHAHHLLQLLPFAALAAAWAIDSLLVTRLRLPVAGLAVLSFVMMMSALPEKYREVGGRLGEGPVVTGPAGQLADYVSSHCKENCSVFLMSDHIAYWLLGQPVPTRMAHPTNIGRSHLYSPVIGLAATPELELERIFAGRPHYVVMPLELPMFSVAAREVIDSNLNRNYRVVHQYYGRRVYERVSESPT